MASTATETQKAVPSAEQWMEESATKTLTLEEMDALLTENQELWAIHDEIDKRKKEAYKLAEESDEKIMSALKAAGKDSYKVDGLGTAGIRAKLSVCVPKTIEAKRIFVKYLQKQLGPDGALAMLTVNSNTLNSWYSEKFDEAAAAAKKTGKALDFEIPGIEAPTTRETLYFTKDRKTKGKS